MKKSILKLKKVFVDATNKPGILFRIIADQLNLVVIYLLMFIVRFFIDLLATDKINNLDFEKYLFKNYISIYLSTVPMLIIVSILVFSISGFYTRGRFYQSRYKVILIINSNSLVWLIFSLIIYMSQHAYTLPRSVFMFSWLSSTIILLLSRFIITFWQRSINLDPRYARKYYSKNRSHNVLVIGGAGYIGSILTRKLLKEGYRVRVLDLFLYGDESLKAIIDNVRLEIFEGDSRNINTVIRAMDGVDTVIHLGEIVGDPACALNDNLTIDINVAATRMIAQAAQGFGISRFIYVSSCSVYGFSDGWSNELSDLNPVSLYAKAKITAEKALFEIKDDDFICSILRLGTVFGMSYRPRFDLVVNLLAAKAIQDKKITVIGGDQWRPFIHVKDVANVILKVVQSPKEVINKKIFNVGIGNYTISDVAKLINDKIPESETIELDFEDDPRNYRVEFNRLNKEVNYIPSYTLENGIDEIIEAYDNGIISNYKEDRYSNYSILKEYNKHLIGPKLDLDNV